MKDEFCFRNCLFPYFDHPYNGTRINERTVEVPIALHILSRAKNALEVGAVTPHYLEDWKHEVVDLHEEYPGVVNQDILDYEPINKPFDLIFSISTLDHLQDQEQVCRAILRMKSWLDVDGVLFVTLPYGQPPEVGGGPWLDELVLSCKLGMHVSRMDKINSKKHLWAEQELYADPLEYNGRSNFANTVYFLSYINFGEAES